MDKKRMPEDRIATKKSLKNIKDKKLKGLLKLQDKKLRLHKEEMKTMAQLQLASAGCLEPENDMEKTWKVRQDVLMAAVPVSTAAKAFDLKLQSGPYSSVSFTRNGRHMLIGSRSGHVAAFDWKVGKLLGEHELGETVHSLTWLHQESMYAVAQDKYVYIYDSNGVELHALREHRDATHLTFLPYHMLLVSGGTYGMLRYQDISTGEIKAEHRTNLGSCRALTQNPQNAIVHAGHTNGTVSLWTPSMGKPCVTMLSHRGAVSHIAIDRTGTYMATAGVDSYIKVWDVRKYQELHAFRTRIAPSSLSISQTGLLAVSAGSSVTIWKDALSQFQNAPYMTHCTKGSKIDTALFCPYEDIMALGHADGISTIIIPGSAEANFDSYAANPFETKKQRREGEIKSLLNKLQADTIALDTDYIGQIRDNK